jgi:hypothetical protein
MEGVGQNRKLDATDHVGDVNNLTTSFGTQLVGNHALILCMYQQFFIAERIQVIVRIAYQAFDR